MDCSREAHACRRLYASCGDGALAVIAQKGELEVCEPRPPGSALVRSLAGAAHQARLAQLPGPRLRAIVGSRGTILPPVTVLSSQPGAPDGDPALTTASLQG